MNQHQPTAADFFAQPAEDDEAFDAAMEAWKADPGMLHVIPPSPLERIAEALESLSSLNVKLPDLTGKAVAEGLNKAASTAERSVGERVDDAVAYLEKIAYLQEQLADLADKTQVAYAVIEEVEAALGKSKAAPALAAKAVIEEWRNPQVPSVPEGEDEPPSPPSDEPDAPVIGPITSNLDVHTRAETDAGADICQECSYAAQDYVVWPCPEVKAAFDPLGVEAEPQPDLPSLADMDEANEPVQPAHDAPVEEWREYARAQGLAGPHIDKANRSQIRTALGIAHTAGA